MRRKDSESTYAEVDHAQLFKYLNPADFENLSEEKISVFLKRLSALRNAKKLSQAQLGKSLGMSAQAYGNIEKGNRIHIGSSEIFKLAHRLNCTPDYLIGYSDDPLLDRAGKTEPIKFHIEDGDPKENPNHVTEVFHFVIELRQKDIEVYNALLSGLNLKGKKYTAFRNVIIAAAELSGT